MGIQLTAFQRKLLEQSIHELQLPIRIINALETHAGVYLVSELLNMKPESVIALPNFGQKTLETIYESLERYGFYRQGREPPSDDQAADIEARRKHIRDALGGTAADDWDAEILFRDARARKRRGRQPRNDGGDSQG